MSVVELVQPQGEFVADFDTFWLVYPRHVAKKSAAKAWDALTDAQRMAAVVGAAAWRGVWLRRGELEYVPYPGTWLRGERWEDELPVTNLPAHASQVAAVLPERGERTTMPDHVRALIAKLRGRV